MSHTSVLLHESIEGLAICEGDVFVDATLGDGGHSAEILKRFGDKVTIVGIDRDADAVERAAKTLGGKILGGHDGENDGKGKLERVVLKQGDFRNIESTLASLGFENAQRFLFDIGLSSRQIEESGRGFSFQKDEPLLMTFEKSSEGPDGFSRGAPIVTAKEVVNEWQEETLVQIIKGFGEERFAGRIARGIVETRKEKVIETTGDLVEIIMKSTPFYYHRGKIHPATRTFQAIRIAVNDELEAIRDGLKSAWKLLTPAGRIAVISFHSLEDRIVKQYFNELKKTGAATVITKKPIVASEAEIKSNPRARSAKLRIIKKN